MRLIRNVAYAQRMEAEGVAARAAGAGGDVVRDDVSMPICLSCP
jgi:hypothetical protein